MYILDLKYRFIFYKEPLIAPGLLGVLLLKLGAAIIITC